MSTQDLRRLLRQVDETPGWSVELTRSSHYKIVSPDGKRLTGPSTSASPRTFANLRAKLRRHGWRPT